MPGGRTTIRLYRESTESGVFDVKAAHLILEPPYGSTERALKVYTMAKEPTAISGTTIRLYRESTER